MCSKSHIISVVNLRIGVRAARQPISVRLSRTLIHASPRRWGSRQTPALPRDDTPHKEHLVRAQSLMRSSICTTKDECFGGTAKPHAYLQHHVQKLRTFPRIGDDEYCVGRQVQKNVSLHRIHLFLVLVVHRVAVENVKDIIAPPHALIPFTTEDAISAKTNDKQLWWMYLVNCRRKFRTKWKHMVNHDPIMTKKTKSKISNASIVHAYQISSDKSDVLCCWRLLGRLWRLSKKSSEQCQRVHDRITKNQNSAMLAYVTRDWLAHLTDGLLAGLDALLHQIEIPAQSRWTTTVCIQMCAWVERSLPSFCLATSAKIQQLVRKTCHLLLNTNCHR